MTISRTADHIYECLMMDTWPRQSGAIDFGLDHPDASTRYAYLQRVVRHTDCNADDLHRVVGSGPDITNLVKRYLPDQVGTPIYTTAYDYMEDDWDGE